MKRKLIIHRAVFGAVMSAKRPWSPRFQRAPARQKPRKTHALPRSDHRLWILVY
ncbi:MAG: hypothetical protein ACR2L2_03210 [Acidobacteriota bacterium]